MSFLIDTDICSAHLKGDRRVFTRINQYGGRVHVSVVSLAELYSWVKRPMTKTSRARDLADLLLRLRILNLDQAVAEKFGEVQAHQYSTGQFTPEMDLLIASTALVHGLTLVTHNVQDFANVPGLQVVDWLAP